MPLIATLITALFITIVLTPWLMQHAVSLQLVDMPGERKVHTHLVPRVGGIAMVLGMLLPFLIWFPKDRIFFGILAGLFVLVCFGIWDDRRDLNYRIKFAGQLLAAVLVVGIGSIHVSQLPFVTNPIPYWISYPFTVFCLLAITNAMNLSDGLDGLAGGASILSFGVLGLISYQSGSFPLVLVTLSVVGSILGFLRFNSHPARIFMGDTGSQFLGFILGVLVVVLTQKANPALSPMLPLLIFGLPVVDTVSVMVKRVVAGKSPFSPDKNHVHHRLLAMGFSHYETVVLLYLLQFGYVLLAYILRFYMDKFVILAFVCYTLVILGGIHLALRYDWIRIYDLRPERIGKMLAPSLRSLLRKSLLSRVMYLMLLIILPLYSILALLVSDRFSFDIVVLAMVLASLLFINIAMLKQRPWIDAVSMYTACALLVYLGYLPGEQDTVVVSVDWILVVALGIIVWLSVMLSGQSKFETSPLDFLVIMITLLVPLLSSQTEVSNPASLAIVKFVVLLYAFEYVRNGASMHDVRLIRLSLMVCMLIIGSRLIW